MATINMHMKFEIEIPKQSWLMLRKPCRLQTDGQTDKVNPVYPPPSNFVGRGYKNLFINNLLTLNTFMNVLLINIGLGYGVLHGGINPLPELIMLCS